MAITFSSLPKAYNFTRNPVRIVGLPGADPSLTEIKLFITIGSTTIVLSETPDLTLYPTGDCPFEFDVAPVIDEYLQNEFAEPEVDGTGIQTVAGYPIPVTIEWEEYEEGDLISSGDLADIDNGGDPFLFLQGGVDFIALMKSQEFLNEYYDSLLVAPFLTWQKTKLVDRSSQPVLYWLNKDFVADDIFIWIEVFDGSTLIDTKVIGHSVPDPQTLYQVYCGWEALELTAFLAGIAYTGHVSHYTVAIYEEDAEEPITEAITFVVDPKYYKNKTYLHFQNSLDGFDEMRFIGHQERKVELDRKNAIQDLVSETRLSDGLRRVYSVEEQLVLKAYSGYMGETRANSMRELLLSPRIFELRDGVMIPVELSEKTKDLIKTIEFMQDMVLEYRYLFTDRSFTPRGVLPDATPPSS